MAEILVLRDNVVPTNPEHPGAWEAGMIVDIYPDGQLGPGSQQHPKFFVIRIPGISQDDAIEFINDIVDPQGNMIKRRSKKLDFNTIPQPGARDDIDNDRDTTIPNISVLRSWLVDTV